METSDEDKLIINGELFFSVRKYMRQNKPSAEIIAKIEEVLKEGADINACDYNDNNNTVLHIAAQKGDKDIVLYLLQNGALLFRNKNEKTPADLAVQTNTVIGKEIANILSQKGKPAARVFAKTPENKQTESSNQQVDSIQKLQTKATTTTSTKQEVTYPKRSGTSGVSGQFYETKLLSLVLHRALHDQEIENFYLAANIRDIGDFDDVCFRYKNVACYMQTKHRENTDKAKLTVASVRSSTGKLGLGIYFDSFLKIRQKFSPNSSDPMFQGKFDEMDIYFVLYTPLKESFERKLSNNTKMCTKLHDIIYTGETNMNKSIDMFQFDYEDRDLDYLATFIKYEHIKVLGKAFLEFILSNKKLEVMMTNDLIKIYHPALAQKVVSITKVEDDPKPIKDLQCQKNQNLQNTSVKSNVSNYIHMGKFRPDFFNSEDHNLNKLKDIFVQEIVFTHSPKTELSKEELKQRIRNIADDPSPETISSIIGCPIKFDDTTDKLVLDLNKLPKNKYKQDEIQQIRYDLQKIQVTRTIVRNAVNLAGQKKLQNLTFQLPQSFGNLDLTINKKTKEDIEDRLNFLAGRFYSLINHFAERNKHKQTKIIDISSDVVGPGKILQLTHLSSNGGIGAAVGNLLRFETQHELFAFNTHGELGENAKYILQKLKSMTGEDMTNYKMNIIIDGFPRVTFDTYKYDRDVAAQFLSKLWFYTNQAQEESVEITLKKEINTHYNADKQRNQFLFHVHSDAIFLRFHDEIQKWWKKQTEASYLTKNTTIFDNAKKEIVDNPLLTVLNVMFIRKIKNIGIVFNADAVDCLSLDEFKEKTNNQILNITSDAVILSAAKIMQCNKFTNNHSFINLGYVDILPDDDRKTMMKELSLVNDMTLVIISETPLVQSLRDTLQDILNHFKLLDSLKKQIIIITNEPIKIDQLELLNSNDYVVLDLKDNNVNLLDLTTESQTILLDKCIITYQGQEVNLSKLLDENSKELINAKLLWALLNKDKIEIGHTLETHKYNEIENYYISRNLKRNGEEYPVGALDDIDDKIVLISSKPCMGKTILLTHLSLETKKSDPKPWIVRINFSIHDKYIEKLKYNNDINAIMALLCKAALKKPDEITKVNFVSIDNEKVAINYKSSDDVSFELQFFINCYNNGNIIFLFDGFDKIYPQFTQEGIKLFTAIKEANKRMWITSDCYVISILENIFGASYKLEQLSTIQQNNFLQRFWSTNLKLEKLNHDQFNNITIFINYIRRTFNCKSLEAPEDTSNRPAMPFFSVPLHIIYLTVLDHFKNDANSLSFCYLRDKLKKKWRLNSYTKFDRYLRAPDNGESLKLTGTPLHVYIAANYFKFQITDKFDLNIDSKTISDRSRIYYDAISLYQQFLNVSVKKCCEIENKTVLEETQDKSRDNFFDTHKKIALYAIFKESDIRSILNESEIREVKNTIKMIESGELKTHLIDSVVDGIPRYCNLMFAEYFIVEFLADILKHVKNQDYSEVKLDSLWDFIVNVVLCLSPPSLRHAFEYKLKYDPELEEVASNDNCKKIVFNLLLKRGEAAGTDTENFDTDNALNIAINEGLVNITNWLLKCVKPNTNENNANKLMKILKSSATILEAADTSRSIVSDNVLQCIQSLDGETIITVLNSNNAEMVKDIQDVIKAKIVEPVKEMAKSIVVASENNENLVTLVEQFHYHLPDFIRQFSKK